MDIREQYRYYAWTLISTNSYMNFSIGYFLFHPHISDTVMVIQYHSGDNCTKSLYINRSVNFSLQKIKLNSVHVEVQCNKCVNLNCSKCILGKYYQIKYEGCTKEA